MEINRDKIESAKFVECKEKAKSKIRTGFFPGCNEKSINSHILQKNGILSSIAKDNHLWEIGVNPFKSPKFHPQKTGINKIFSFNCFCNKHDTDLFSEIEKEEIDLESYRTLFLFTIRTFYNELFRKLVGIDQFRCLIEKEGDAIRKELWSSSIEQLELAVKDLDFLQQLIWKDYNSKSSQSFELKYREINHVELILSSFFTYETTSEIHNHKLETGRDFERLSTIFVSIFPHKGKSILLMGYVKDDEKKVKGYVNQFFKENEKRIQRKLTNLLMFQCENWVCSEKFYNKKIKDKEQLFANATYFSQLNTRERRVFDLNIFRDDFDAKLKKWNDEYGR